MRAVGFVCVLIVASFGAPALGLGGPENVLVVDNSNSPVSQRIAAYYVSQRGIPAGNMATINTVDSSLSSANESISPADYTSLIEQPIRTYLSTHGLTDQIQYIVLTKGIPIKLAYDPFGGQYGPQSVDSMLAAMDLIDPLLVEFTDSNHNVVASVYANRFWRSQAPFAHSTHGGYLVTRLDGYTEDDAKALVTRALAPPASSRYLLDVDPNRGLGTSSLQPKSILLPDGTLDPNYHLGYEDFNADMIRASQILVERPNLSVLLDTSITFMGSTEPLLGYVSWGSNDNHYNSTTYRSLTFGARSVVETAVSTSGRTFLPTTGGQSLIADLIAQGAAGAKGYVSEPFLHAVASPTVLFDLYSSGRNLAESCYAASRFVRWKDVVLGDPLCCLAGQAVSTIAAARDLADGTLVSMTGKTVSAGTEDFGDRFYIQEPNRPSGIQIYIGQSFAGIPRGSVVGVRGIIGTRFGERCILNPSITGPGPGPMPFGAKAFGEPAPWQSAAPACRVRGVPLNGHTSP